jgi:hypothetical protein
METDFPWQGRASDIIQAAVISSYRRQGSIKPETNVWFSTFLVNIILLFAIFIFDSKYKYTLTSVMGTYVPEDHGGTQNLLRRKFVFCFEF